MRGSSNVSSGSRAQLTLTINLDNRRAASSSNLGMIIPLVGATLVFDATNLT